MVPSWKIKRRWYRNFFYVLNAHQATLRFAFCNASDLQSSDVVTIGVPDESRSHAKRKGTSDAPDRIREVSNAHDTYTRKEKTTVALAYERLEKDIFDYGNISRKHIADAVSETVGSNKIPVFVGGDHSISYEIVKSISGRYESPVSLVYFDAHPDIVSSTTNYYGSVFYDLLPFMEQSSSLQVGIRSCEKEELDNIKKHNVSVITPFDVTKKGVSEIAKEIEQRTDGKNVYISFDMDAVDPAFAPGVSAPVPAGLGSTEAIFLAKEIAQKADLIGMDVMEVCPSYDIKERTCHLASKIMVETVSSLK